MCLTHELLDDESFKLDERGVRVEGRGKSIQRGRKIPLSVGLPAGYVIRLRYGTDREACGQVQKLGPIRHLKRRPTHGWAGTKLS